VSTEKIVLIVALLSLIVLGSSFWLQTDRPRMINKSAPPVWSELDIRDLRRCFRDNMPVSDIAGFLLRTEDEVRGKAQDLGIALDS
jgi:hypothetical protein